MKTRITKEQLNKVKQIDLLTYLMNYEPEDLVKKSRNVYGSRTHSSLQLSNGLWTYWAKGIGGKSALDYLIKVQGFEFLEAAHYLLSCLNRKEPMKPSAVPTKGTNNSALKLPPPNGNNDKIIHYLCHVRCLNRNLVDECIRHYEIYECREDHSVVFVGFDDNNKAKYGMQRSIVDDGKKEVYGSDKRYSFSLSKNKSAKELHIFEGVIDLLSFITLQIKKGIDWKQDSYLSLGGASVFDKSNNDLPVALQEYLSKYETISSINLHLDNDKAGIKTTEKITFILNDKYKVTNHKYRGANDVNHYLMNKMLLFTAILINNAKTTI